MPGKPVLPAPALKKKVCATGRPFAASVTAVVRGVKETRRGTQRGAHLSISSQAALTFDETLNGLKKLGIRNRHAPRIANGRGPLGAERCHGKSHPHAMVLMRIDVCTTQPPCLASGNAQPVRAF